MTIALCNGNFSNKHLSKAVQCFGFKDKRKLWRVLCTHGTSACHSLNKLYIFFWEHIATLHNCINEIPIRFLYNICMWLVSGNMLPIFYQFKNSDGNTLAKERKYNPVHYRCADSIRLNLNCCFNSTHWKVKHIFLPSVWISEHIWFRSD